jgi:hypothetical protein
MRISVQKYSRSGVTKYIVKQIFLDRLQKVI